MLAVLLFVLAPVIGTLWTSFFRDVSYLPRELVGLENYRTVLTNRQFWHAVWFTLAFTVVAVAGEAVFGLAFAVLLHQGFRGRGILRTVILVPWAIPTIVSAKVWKLIFEYTYGVLNFIATNIGLSEAKVNWLGTTFNAFWALIIAEVWKTTPFMVIILLAGLQAVPEDIYSQARIDGARMMRRFWTMTLPLLRPVLVIALVFRTIDSLRIFDLVYVLTGGGPGGGTTTLSMLGYEYFTNDRFGLGSTVSLLTFAVAMAVTILYIRVGRFRQSLEQGG
ncbi:MAG: ABC transporter permease subunit [Chitinivibrionales bacterium]|nr:ABC transporter permease subunit [Chitinivibrionales bacterium]